MQKILLKNAILINEGKELDSDLLIENGRIEKIGTDISDAHAMVLDLSGHYIMPGAIDDQVHFREPGLTHKGTIATESAAAVLGGVTTFMEMPNTIPNALTHELLEDKYNIAAISAVANYSFFMGVSNDNIAEVLKTNDKKKEICGVKIFMGSSTGSMLVDNEKTLRTIFEKSEMLIATHCESEGQIADNSKLLERRIPRSEWTSAMHPVIRDVQACFLSSSFAVSLAKEYNTRLHILHLTTAAELSLFDNSIPLIDKRITSEVCVHHLTFNDNDYNKHGNNIKCNPAIKNQSDQDALWKALIENKIDVIATDHAPHTMEEKAKHYLEAPAGLPLVQHSVPLMLEHHSQGRISLTQLVEKMCHAPADIFQVKERGYLREGYWADIVVFSKNPFTVKASDLLYTFGWSPFEDETFSYRIDYTFVNGNMVVKNGQYVPGNIDQRIEFERT